MTDPLSLNLYTYCDNNTIIYTDPSGHVKEEVRTDIFVDINMRVTPYIKLDSKGQYVRDAETWLYVLGYKVTIDGTFTKDEVMMLNSYVNKNKLKYTNGVIDNETYHRLWMDVKKKKYESNARKNRVAQNTITEQLRVMDFSLNQPQYKNPNYSQDFYSY